MTNLALSILFVALFANILLGLLVISRDYRNATNRLFFALVLLMSMWGVFSFYSTNHSNTLFFARMVLFTAVPFATCFFFFVLTFPKQLLSIPLKYIVLASFWSAVVMAVTLTPITFKSIKITGGNVGTPVVGPGIGIFGATVLFYDLGGLIVLARKTWKSSGEERVRRLYLWIGLAVMLSLIIVFEFILPSGFSNTRFVAYATVFIFPFIAATTYAIIKHRLLDIRAAVARSVAYLMSLSFIGVLYGVVIFGVSIVITSLKTLNSTDQKFVYIGFALITTLIFPYTKKFFDRLTNKLFYRDAYETQIVLDQLSGLLVAEIDLRKITKTAVQILKNAVKSSYIEFVLFGEKNELEIQGDPKLLQVTISSINEYLKTHTKDVIVTDELSTENAFKALLIDNNIAVMQRLKTQHQVVGYMIFGAKLSGNIYNAQDIKLLTISANELAVATQNALRFTQTEKFNITLQEKVDEATKQLRKTNENLKALDETKDDFISMASHQLRTPLTSVKGYVSMVLDGDAGKLNKNQAKLLDQAYTSSQNMVYLIADLLNVSRLKTGKFVIERSPTNLAEVIEQELGQLGETVQLHELKLNYTKPDHFPILNLDETKTRQVIMNFIDNAIYYTPKGGSIEIGLLDKGKSVEFTVQDTGIGVPKSEVHHLFSKFYRAGNARKARPDGTGLGLFMAKKVVIAQNGSIIFNSVEGKGSTFGFSFPREATSNHKG